MLDSPDARDESVLPEPLMRLTDYVIGPQRQSALVDRAERIVSLTLMQSSVFLFALTLLWAAVLPAVAGLTLVIATVPLLGLVLVRRGRYDLALHLGGAGLALHWVVVAWSTGGWRSPTVLAFVVLPILPATQRFFGSAALWTAITLLLVPLLAAAEHLGLQPGAAPTTQGFTLITLTYVMMGVVLTFSEMAGLSRRTQVRLASANSELTVARDRADAGNQAKSSFLTAMTHELRTPMNGVLGMAGLLLESPLDARQRDQVETIRQSAIALVDIVDELLDFSRIEAGQLRLDEAPFEPLAIVRQVADLLRLPAREKGLRLDVELGPRLPGRTLGDGGRVRQILFNLIGNAVKYTDSGRVTVRVSAADDAAESVRLIVEVEDTGIGIAREDLERMWVRFTQVHEGVQRRAAGTGLGLAISKHVVELMGGTLTATSQVGEGSRFVVELPLRIVSDTGDDTDRALPPLPAARVLVAEDNPVNRKVTLAMLDHLGLVGDAVSDGQAAVNMARLHTYDLVLMDCEMPVLDGYDACRVIREGGQRMPVLAMTAHSHAEVRQRCVAAGMNDHVQKPVRLETLHKILDHWLNHAR